MGYADDWPTTLEGYWDQMLEPTGLTFDGLSASEQNWSMSRLSPRNTSRSTRPRASRRGFGTVSGKVEFASSILADLGYDPVRHMSRHFRRTTRTAIRSC